MAFADRPRFVQPRAFTLPFITHAFFSLESCHLICKWPEGVSDYPQESANFLRSQLDNARRRHVEKGTRKGQLGQMFLVTTQHKQGRRRIDSQTTLKIVPIDMRRREVSLYIDFHRSLISFWRFLKHSLLSSSLSFVLKLRNANKKLSRLHKNESWRIITNHDPIWVFLPKLSLSLCRWVSNDDLLAT